jgi:DNA-binding winged helix-turn-helix (wHTH) protein
MPDARHIRFGDYDLDLAAGELRKAGRRLRLPGQSFVVLAALLEHPSELVTRDELCRRLWTSDTFVDFEHGLNAAVKRLRQTLGDSAVSPIYVETLPRRGYRFIAPVEASCSSRPRRLQSWCGLKPLALSAFAWLAALASQRASANTEKDGRTLQLVEPKHIASGIRST